ncbi:MAG TPA: penicillin-binding protein 2 [bacterium]|nr:penicillin-binding protein 2 [bacterium]
MRRPISPTSNNSRIYILQLTASLGVLVLIVRLFFIQVLGHEKYKALAQDQYWNLQEIPAKRGDILSSDSYKLATTQVSFLLYAQPKVLLNINDAAQRLSETLTSFVVFEDERSRLEYKEKTYAKIYDSLNLDLYWVRLASGLDPDQKAAIESLGITGIGFEEQPARYYPEGSLASHVLGFVASNEEGNPQGYFGIEGALNGDLQGRPGRIVEERDALGNPILVGGYKRIDSIDGRDISLSINRAVQYMVESRLKEGVETYGAISGSVIVMDPFTGDVIAMANYPTYDPTDFSDFGMSEEENLEGGKKKIERTNLAISQTYEPGSVIKSLTVSAGIDLGKIVPESTFVDAGPVVYSDYTINNWDGRHHGVQTIVQLLQKSNNIGAAWVGHLVGASSIVEYFRNFGLGNVTGIELEGEDTGLIKDADTLTNIDLATMSFGQGMSATPLQVLNAFNSIVNGGNLMRPRIVQKIIESDRVIDIPAQVLRRVISKEASATMTGMLTQAVSGGESRYFNLKGYDIAGKTGTAQIPVNGKYDPSKTNATFIGYLPTSKKFTMLVKLQEPSSSTYASETAVPLWMQIANDLVNYYGIAPDDPSAVEPLKSPQLISEDPEAPKEESAVGVVEDVPEDSILEQ